MSPKEITFDNALILIPDFRRRILASEARKFADNNFPKRRLWRKCATYWDEVIVECEKLFWHETYAKRKARLQRMKG
jgi:hypothetical protein